MYQDLTRATKIVYRSVIESLEEEENRWLRKCLSTGRWIDPTPKRLGQPTGIEQHNKLSLRWLLQRLCQDSSAQYRLSSFRSHPFSSVRNHGRSSRRINKTEILQYNGVFLSLLGLPRFPDQSTLRRFLKRLPPKSYPQLVALHDQLRAKLFVLPRTRTSLIFDLDSVVLTVYGKIQWARVGYNPKKHGRRSYHPLLCFEAHLQEFWHGSLRPGDAAASTGAVPFLKVCLAKAPTTHCPISYPNSSRFGILWQEGHRVSRCHGLRLCDCGQRILHDQSSIQRMSFQKASGRMGSSGVPIQTPQMATTPSLCRRATSHSSRSRRGPTTHALQRPQICLPCLDHQFKDPSLESLAVLCQKSHHRKEHSGTPLRLSLGQDSYRRLGGQCSLLSNLAFCLQPCPLVQETLSTQRIPLYDARYHSDRFLGAASKVDQRRKSKHTDLTSRLSLPEQFETALKRIDKLKVPPNS